MSDTNGAQANAAASLSDRPEPLHDPKVMNLFMTFKAMLDRGEIASMAIGAVRHDGLPVIGFMAPETVQARQSLHSTTMLVASQIEQQIMMQAMGTNRPSPILRPGRPPGM